MLTLVRVLAGLVSHLSNVILALLDSFDNRVFGHFSLAYCGKRCSGGD